MSKQNVEKSSVPFIMNVDKFLSDLGYQKVKYEAVNLKVKYGGINYSLK